ncbi:hypothetical protein Tco_0357093 [Tanacetum coccineum]
MQEPSESTPTISSQQPSQVMGQKFKGIRDKVETDYELAQRLQQEEQEELTIEEKYKLIDDLYNNFKIVEQDVKKSVGASSDAQNLAFMTAPSTSSTNDVNTANLAYEVSTVSPNINIASHNYFLTDDMAEEQVQTNMTLMVFSDSEINCNHHQRKRLVSRNNYIRVDYDYYAKTTHPSVYRNMSPRAVLLKIGLTPLNTIRPVNTAHPKPAVHSAKSMSHFAKQAQSTAQRPFYKQITLTSRYVNTVMRHYRTERPRAGNTARSYTRPVNTVRAKRGKPLMDDKGFVDSGCSRHMTGDIAYLSDFKEFDRGYVTFRGGAHGGRISSKGTLKTDSLDFEDVYFVNELKFNLFSVSQMCDKKNYVLFTDTECLVLSPKFKLPDETQILHKIPRKDNMYSFDMKNIVPKECLTCLVAKATLDESMLWIAYKTF